MSVEEATVGLANEEDIPYSIVPASRNDQGEQLWKFTYKQPGGVRIQDYVTATDLAQAESRVEQLINMWRDNQRNEREAGVTTLKDETFGTSGVA